MKSKLPRMRGRVPAIANLKERVEKTLKEIAFIETLEYGVYEGVINSTRWITGNITEPVSGRLLCELDYLNKESVRVKVLAIKHLTEHAVLELIGDPDKVSITFKDFMAFKPRELDKTEIPLYCNLDHVTDAFRKRYML